MFVVEIHHLPIDPGEFAASKASIVEQCEYRFVSGTVATLVGSVPKCVDLLGLQPRNVRIRRTAG